MKNQRKRLFFDIETSPNIGFFWEAGYEIDVGYHNIIKERSIICIGYKWAGEQTVHVLTWDKNQSDKALLQKFLLIFNSADEVVAHNGNRFDIAWIRTKCIQHGIPMMPSPTSIDTLLTARSKFKFNSNKLDYIAKFLGVGGKTETGFDLWKDIVLKKSKTALVKMASYCKHDVVLLEKVFDRMNSYIVAKTHVGGLADSCPECGSKDTIVNKQRITAAGVKRVTFQCKDCGKYHSVVASKFNKART